MLLVSNALRDNSSYAVQKITIGEWLVCCNTSNPLRPGIWISRNTRSGFSRSISSRHYSPFCASPISSIFSAWSANSFLSRSRAGCSSSAIRVRYLGVAVFTIEIFSDAFLFTERVTPSHPLSKGDSYSLIYFLNKAFNCIFSICSKCGLMTFPSLPTNR